MSVMAGMGDESFTSKMRNHSSVIAKSKATKQSSKSLGLLDCFASLAMTAGRWQKHIAALERAAKG
jgi:hypothetical protein